MSINLLSELVTGNRDYTLHAYVSRLWQHRGGTDDGPIKHTDIVFQDTEGNHMYGEIAATLVDQFMGKIEEGKIYELKRFVVGQLKGWYKPVKGEYMIRFGRYTVVKDLEASLMDYPLCTYNLTPIDRLPSPTDNPNFFTDVVGIFTGLSATSQYHSASRSTPSTKRIIYLSDLSGFEISLVLWGERAHAFPGEDVLRTSQTKPVVIIFVGTLVKPFEGRRGLSGGAPCRWYINDDLPEISSLTAQLKGKLPAVRGVSILGQTAAEISAQVDLETKTMKELDDLEIWNHKKTRFYCTAMIAKLSPGERWWFHACTTCGKGTMPYGAAYRCPDTSCECTGGTPRYRLCYLGSDDTGKIELVFFDKAAKELLGKAALTLIRSRVPNAMSVEEAIQHARTDQSTPKELASIVSRKYRLVVSVTTKSFEPNASSPSYQVHRIEMLHGNRPRSAALGRRPGLALASSSNSAEGSGLNATGDALADSLMLTQTKSSSSITNQFDQTSSDFKASTDELEKTLPETPPSIAKPAGLSDGKATALSELKKALLFEEPSPDPKLEVAPVLVPHAQPEKLIMPDSDSPSSLPASSNVASPEKTPAKRKQQKTQPDGAGKKKK